MNYFTVLLLNFIITATFYVLYQPWLSCLCSPDAECWDVCVMGACSGSCSGRRSCPSRYSCMSGRCYAQCDLEEQTNGEYVCGVTDEYSCRLGLSESDSSTGICVFATDETPTTQAVCCPTLFTFSLQYNICSLENLNAGAHWEQTRAVRWTRFWATIVVMQTLSHIGLITTRFHYDNESMKFRFTALL